MKQMWCGAWFVAFPSSLTMELNRKTDEQIKTPTLMETDKEASGMVSNLREELMMEKRKGRGRVEIW